MDLILSSQNLIALVALPIALSTVFNAKKNWSKLWDQDLTGTDRALLMRIALFIIMPIIVLFHECGHAAATLLFGGEVEKFYYGYLWGYVIPRGNFSDWQILWIYLAGNLVEIFLGLVALIVAIRSTKPAMVALSIYVSFWAIAGTLVFYTLLSLIGAYGDWQGIYSTQVPGAVLLIAAFHVIFVIAIIWAAYSQTTALWFARRTRPEMIAPEKILLEILDKDRTTENLLAMAKFYYQNNLSKIAKNYCERVEKSCPDLPENLLMRGLVAAALNQIPESLAFLGRCVENKNSSNITRAIAFIGMADCQVFQTESRLRGSIGQASDWNEAIELYTKAWQAAPELGDPLYKRAGLRMRQNSHKLAEEDLRKMLQLTCLDSNMFESARARLSRLEQIAQEGQ
jgi:hypothetical protein